ncbi:uncharacterized protein KGF55_000506 [Candida pseudojiufengensis]|uniref:uncharacterized protein n=1 Tax=Candida pseudojiufengensis TaxID=497109 RepID=UPI002224BDCB|nr:uncharacterized protein KGF55_000506 [Candida pseudojiufengensis]KAI5966197.1 hypothetical protein KGF55_000506 [Candida pseudojiufengensis]
MGVFNLFGGKSGFDPNKFEKELNSIAENINKTKQQLIKLRINKRSINKKLSLFNFITYLLIFFYSYVSIPIDTIATNRIQRFIKGQSKFNFYLLIGFPLISILITKIINFIFKYLINSQDHHLDNLKQRHKLKIDELKKITKYNETNELINKYDDKPKPTPQQLQQQQQQFINQPNKNTKSKSLREQALKELHLNEQHLSSNQSPIIQQQINHTPKPNLQTSSSPVSPPPAPQKRTIQDKLLDLFIGSDNSESIENRYALICSHCFSHNGLAPPNCDDPNNIKYKCWKCGSMNGKGMLFDENHYNDDQHSIDEKSEPKEETKEKHEDDDKTEENLDIPEMIEVKEHLNENDPKEKSIEEAVPEIAPIEKEIKE